MVRSAMAAFGGELNFLAPTFPFPRFVGVSRVLDLELAACFTLPSAIISPELNARVLVGSTSPPRGVVLNLAVAVVHEP
jgi:hypothetical protein